VLVTPDITTALGWALLVGTIPGCRLIRSAKLRPFSGIEEIFFSASSWPNSVEEGSGIKPSSTTVILSARDSKESFASTRVGFVAPRTSPTWWNGWKEGAEIFSSYRPESPMKK